jgi:lysophospholipase L1-like esterase
MWESTVPFASADQVLAGLARYDGVVRAVARRLGAAYISTQPFGLRGAEWYAERDPIHFNDRGADRMGHWMAQVLIADGTLNPRSGMANRKPFSNATTPVSP